MLFLSHNQVEGIAPLLVVDLSFSWLMNDKERDCADFFKSPSVYLLKRRFMIPHSCI